MIVVVVANAKGNAVVTVVRVKTVDQVKTAKIRIDI